MDLPLCKICGERHRLGGCPKFDNSAAQRREWLKAMLPKGKPDAPETAGAPQAIEHHQAPTAPEAPPPAPQEVKKGFDKVAYQRELMRKRRAAAKANPAPSVIR